MTLHAPGTPVAIGPDASTPATVLAITITGAERAVTYQVAWWDGSDRETAWLSSHEVTSAEPEMRIGFTPSADA